MLCAECGAAYEGAVCLTCLARDLGESGVKIAEKPAKGAAPAASRPAPQQQQQQQQRGRVPSLLRAPIQERGSRPKETNDTRPVTKEGFVQISRSPQAQMLFEQAMKDRAAGNLVSAQRNLKLAVNYDKDNLELKNVLADLARASTK